MLLHACYLFIFFFNDPATTEIYTLSLHDALPILMYDDKEQSVIDFIDKNGNTERTLPLFEIEKIWNKNKSGLEPTAGRYSAKKVMKYLKENNPSSKEFIKWASSTALNKGGLLAKKKPKAYNKGGMVDYRKTGMFK